VAVLFCVIGYHNTGGLKIGRFEVFEEAVLIPDTGRHAVVSDQGLSKDEDLTSV